MCFMSITLLLLFLYPSRLDSCSSPSFDAPVSLATLLFQPRALWFLELAATHDPHTKLRALHAGTWPSVCHTGEVLFHLEWPLMPGMMVTEWLDFYKLLL